MPHRFVVALAALTLSCTARPDPARGPDAAPPTRAVRTVNAPSPTPTLGPATPLAGGRALAREKRGRGAATLPAVAVPARFVLRFACLPRGRTATVRVGPTLRLRIPCGDRLERILDRPPQEREVVVAVEVDDETAWSVLLSTVPEGQ